MTTRTRGRRTRRRRAHYRTPAGARAKKRCLIEALTLIRLLCREAQTRAEVEQRIAIPRREFYRYLTAFRLAGLIPMRLRPDPRGPVSYALDRDAILRWMGAAR